MVIHTLQLTSATSRDVTDPEVNLVIKFARQNLDFVPSALNLAVTRLLCRGLSLETSTEISCMFTQCFPNEFS